MASFSTLNYGEALAGLTAHEWAKRRQHFLDIGAGPYNHSAEDKASYTPSSECVAVVDATAC